MQSALKAMFVAGACLVAASFSAQAAQTKPFALRIRRRRATLTMPQPFNLLKMLRLALRVNSKWRFILRRIGRSTGFSRTGDDERT